MKHHWVTLIFVFILISGILFAVPGLAQEPEMLSLKLDGKERVCLDCHRRPNAQTNEGIATVQGVCWECHGKADLQRKWGTRAVSLTVTPESFGQGRHRTVACIHCHIDVARSPHRTRAGAQCLSCHGIHGEGAAHDPHLRVSCQACHRRSTAVALDKTVDRVVLSRVNDQNIPVPLNDHQLPNTRDPNFCQRCHVPQNKVGAAAAVLPSKSFLCLPCHYAPLVLGHSIFWAALGLFLLGVLTTSLFWLKGSVQGEEISSHRKIASGSEALWSTVFSREFWGILKTGFFDVFLQRRILQESVQRWSIHSLIYLSILIRFALGLATHFAYFFRPTGNLAYALLDKNQPFVALTNDLLGLFILVGLTWAVIRRWVIKPPQVVSEGQDNLAIAIIGLLVILGFLLEGARILVTQTPPGKAGYSFVGFLLAGVMKAIPADWPTWQVYLWYAHAVAGAALIAYLPFGKMKHIFVTPLSLLLNYKRK
jgi:nitrate reductase gamma subunit